MVLSSKHLSRVKKLLHILASDLNSHHTNWVLGGSGGLLVHGVDLIPNDLDFFVEGTRFDQLYLQYSQNILEPLHSYIWRGEAYRKFKLLFEGVKVEIIEYRPNWQKTEIREFEGTKIPVYDLSQELEFYRSRPGKEAVVKLIENRLRYLEAPALAASP